jgi:hypothetical protein
MKKLFAIILPIVLVTALAYGYFAYDIGSVMAYVSVDINPSVQFVTNGNDEVVSVTASNEEGEIILLEEAENLIGLSIEEATEKIVELAIEYGYLDPEALEADPNAITITTVLNGLTQRRENRLRERVKNNLENYLQNNGIFGVVMTDLDMEDVVLEAEELGISAGNLKIIKSVQALYPELTTEEALELSVKDLMGMLREQNLTNPSTELESAAQIRRQLAAQKYSDWVENREARAETVKARWENFKDNLTDEQKDAILDYFQNAFEGLRP